MAEYVEASPGARKTCIAAVGACILAGFLLGLAAKALPEPVGEPSVILQTIADRALVSAALVSAIHLFVAALVVWLAARVVASEQWPPVGLPMPYRQKVRKLKRPRLVWVAVALLVGLKAILVVMYWRQYLQLLEIVQLVKQ